MDTALNNGPGPGKLLVVRGGTLSSNTAQTVGMPRRAAISKETTGAQHLWVGRVVGEPGMDSGPHHHGEAETCGFILSGTPRIYYGEEYAEFVDLEPGDFIYIGPFVPHIESNPHDTPVEFITARSPDNIVVNLDLAVDLSPHRS
jgi:uncharacterized RmlC-like cupin family protein